MAFISLILTLCLTFAAQAAPRDLVLPLDADLKGRSRLSGDEVQKDLDFLQGAIQSGYLGPALTEAVRSIAVQNTNSQDLCNDLAEKFAQIPNAHLGATLEFKVCGEGHPPGQVGQNIARDRWLHATVGSSGRRIEALAIPSFWPRYDQRWQGFLDAVRRLRTQNRPFVLDLRGNRGGDQSMATEMARILHGFPLNVDLPSPIESLTYRQSPEAFALLANQWTWSILRMQNAGRSVPDYMFSRREEVLRWIERAEAGEFEDPFTISLAEVEVDQRRVFRPKIYVLIDRQCASSCEATLQMLEGLPGRVLVGENTLGSVEYGELGRVVLPHSRVTIGLSTMKVQFKDGRRVERLGYAPDIPVISGEDALATVVNSL